MVRLLYQFFRFSVVGIFCFSIDYALMVFMTEATGVPYFLSSGISFSAATVINYFLSVRFVFDHSAGSRSDIIVFFILGVIGLTLNQFLMLGFVEVACMHYMISKVISGTIVSFYNFFSRKIFLERSRKVYNTR